MFRTIVQLVRFLSIALLISACGSGGGSSSPPPEETNVAPVFSSAITVSVAENSTGVVYQATANDSDGDSLSFSISGGPDAAFFSINSGTGEISFINIPNFEVPADADNNNAYELVLSVSDGTASVSLSLSVTVTDAADAPIYSGDISFSLFENASFVGTVPVDDEDSDESFSYVISGGDDSGLFSINQEAEIQFLEAPIFDSPKDADINNEYLVEVTATDSDGLSITYSLSVTVLASSRFTTQVTYPTHKANFGGVESAVISGFIKHLDGEPFDISAINKVLVNEVEATLTAGDKITWSAQVPLALFENEFLITLIDSEQKENVISFTADNQVTLARPDGVVYDKANDRLLVIDSRLEVLVEIDALGKRKVLIDKKSTTLPLFFSAKIALDSAHNKLVFFYSDSIFSLDLGTLEIATISSNTTGSGELYTEPTSYALDLANGRALVANYLYDEVFEKELIDIYAVELSSGARSVITTQEQGEGPELVYPSAMAVNQQGTVAYLLDGGVGLVSVDLATGNRVLISDLILAEVNQLLTFEIDRLEEFAYISVQENDRGNRQDGRILKVSLEDGTYETLSSPEIGDGPAIIYPNGLVLDEDGNRLVVSDRGSASIVKVVLTSGNRQVFSKDRIGQGINLYGLEHLVYRESTNEIYGLNNLAFVDRSLVRFNLSSASRGEASGENQGSGVSFIFPNGLALSADQSSIFVADSGLDNIVNVNLANGARTEVPEAVEPSFRAPTGIVHDGANNRLIVSDTSNGTLVTVDLVTGARTLVADGDSGGGPMRQPAAIVYEQATDTVFVLLPLDDAILSVDMKTGNKSLVTGNVAGFGNVGEGENLRTSRNMAADLESQTLYVIDSSVGLIAVDIATGNREVISSNSLGGGVPFIDPRGIAFDKAHDRFFIGDRIHNSLIVVDKNTGDRAVSAK